MKKWIFLIMVFVAAFFSADLIAQDCSDITGASPYSSNQDINIGDSPTNEACTRPSSSGDFEMSGNGDLILQGSGRVEFGEGTVIPLVATGEVDVSFTSQGVFSLNTTDTLFVFGDLTTGTSNSDITITQGTLIVSGSFTVNGNATIGADGNVIIGGNFIVNSSGKNNDITVGGGFSVGGTADLGDENINVESGAVFKAETLTSTGELTVEAGGTAFVETGLGNITVDSTNTTGDTNCTNNCCGELCNPTTDELTPEGEAVLPIKLFRFDASQEKNAIVLNWSTVSEQNFSHFELYKLTDDGRCLIDEVSSTFQTNGDSYHFVDESPSLGLNIYQLQSVDFDGYTEWFEPTSILFQPEDVSFQLYPNSGRPEELTTDIYEDFQLEVFNLVGERTMITTVRGKDLSQIRGLKPGNYVFRYNINGHLETQRMVIR